MGRWQFLYHRVDIDFLKDLGIIILQKATNLVMQAVIKLGFMCKLLESNELAHFVFFLGALTGDDTGQ